MMGMNSLYWITLSSFSSASARICRICLLRGGAGAERGVPGCIAMSVNGDEQGPELGHGTVQQQDKLASKLCSRLDVRLLLCTQRAVVLRCNPCMGVQ